MTWPRIGLRGASRLEFAVVVGVVGVLAALLLQRLDDTLSAAHRIQLQMAAEQLRVQAELLDLRCGPAVDRACWQRLLAQRRLAPDQAERPEVAAAAPTSDALGRLQVLAQIAGLMAARDETHAEWRVQALHGDRLQLALRSRSGCRLVVGQQAGSGRVEVQAFPSEC